jgi:hypothetical protein
VRIAAADHSELEGIRTQAGSEIEPQAQRRARVLEGKLRAVIGASPEVGDVPGLVVGELVVGREQGVRLAVALVLGDLEQRLPARASRSVLGAERLAPHRLDREHLAAAEVRVVRNHEHTASRLVFVRGEIPPQALRVAAVEGAKREDLPRLVGAVCEDDVSVAVVAVRDRRPFETDERGEDTGGVVTLGVGDDRLPDRRLQGLVLEAIAIVENRFGKLHEDPMHGLRLAPLVPARGDRRATRGRPGR